jgi:hypothetical protein
VYLSDTGSSRNYIIRINPSLSKFALDSLSIVKPVSGRLSSETIVPLCQVGNARSKDTARVEVATGSKAVVRLNEHGAHPAYELAVIQESRSFVQLSLRLVEGFIAHLNRDRLIPESAMGLSSSRHSSCQCAGID